MEWRSHFFYFSVICISLLSHSDLKVLCSNLTDKTYRSGVWRRKDLNINYFTAYAFQTIIRYRISDIQIHIFLYLFIVFLGMSSRGKFWKKRLNNIELHCSNVSANWKHTLQHTLRRSPLVYQRLRIPRASAVFTFFVTYVSGEWLI
jgi:hypothetical protein